MEQPKHIFSKETVCYLLNKGLFKIKYIALKTGLDYVNLVNMARKFKNKEHIDPHSETLEKLTDFFNEEYADLQRYVIISK